MRKYREIQLCVAILAALPMFAQTLTPGALAARAKAQNVPEIPYESVPNLLKFPPNLFLGEGIGVATNSKGHIFVYTRSQRTRLFEFDQKGTYVREIGEGLYGFVFAHAVRVDPQDNIWAVDEGSNMVIKFNPEGRVIMTLGRRPEPTDSVTTAPPAGPAAEPGKYIFDRPTDVGWDAAGNIFVSDGYGNSRVVKYDKNGKFIASVGSKGSAQGQLNLPHSMALDAQGNVYCVGDRSNRRISKVFDDDLKFKTIYDNVRRAVGSLHFGGAAPVSLLIELVSGRQRFHAGLGDRRDLQDGARRHDFGALRQGGQAVGRVQRNARDRLPESGRAFRGGNSIVARAENRSAPEGEITCTESYALRWRSCAPRRCSLRRPRFRSMRRRC